MIRWLKKWLWCDKEQVAEREVETEEVRTFVRKIAKAIEDNGFDMEFWRGGNLYRQPKELKGKSADRSVYRLHNNDPYVLIKFCIDSGERFSLLIGSNSTCLSSHEFEITEHERYFLAKHIMAFEAKVRAKEEAEDRAALILNDKQREALIKRIEEWK